MGGRVEGPVLPGEVLRRAGRPGVSLQSGAGVRQGAVLGPALLLPGLRLVEVVLPLPLRPFRLGFRQHRRRQHRFREGHQTGTRSCFVLYSSVYSRVNDHFLYRDVNLGW